MQEALFVIFMLGVAGSGLSFAAGVFLLLDRKWAWRRAVTVEMIATLVAATGALGTCRYYVLISDLSALEDVIPTISAVVAAEAIGAIGLWGIGKVWERCWEP